MRIRKSFWTVIFVHSLVDMDVFLTWNRFTATEPSDKARTAKGVTFRAKVMELKTATTVKAYVLWQKYKQDFMSSSSLLFTSLGQEVRSRNMDISPVLQSDHSPEPCEEWTCRRWRSPLPLEPHLESGSEHNRPTPGSSAPRIEPLHMWEKTRVLDWQLYYFSNCP